MTSTVEINNAQVQAGPVMYRTKIEDDGTVSHSIRIRTATESAVADLTDEEARFFFAQGQQFVDRLNPPEDLWTKLPTYAAVEADRERIAARNAALYL